MSEAKSVSITINLSEGGIVISGSEEFVERNLDSVFAFVERNRSVSPMKQIKNVDSDEPTFESAIQILDSNGNELNVIVRKYYNSRRIPREEDKEPELVYNIFDDIVSS